MTESDVQPNRLSAFVSTVGGVTAQQIADAYLHSAWEQSETRLAKAQKLAQRMNVNWSDVQKILDETATKADHA